MPRSHAPAPRRPFLAEPKPRRGVAIFCALAALCALALPSLALPSLALAAPAAVVLRGGTLWTATGAVLPDTDLLLSNGQIALMGKGLTVPPGTAEVDVRGKIVTPGLVDMHSHLGLYAVPNSLAHSDGNEMTSPTTPMVRAIDAFDPEDAAIARAVAGGVTTALILPGSGNAMGGQAPVDKNAGGGDAHRAAQVPQKNGECQRLRHFRPRQAARAAQ